MSYDANLNWVCQEESKSISQDQHIRIVSSLIPGLPNDVAQLCLAKVARAALLKIRFVCTAWKRLVESKEFAQLRLQVGSAERWLYALTERPTGASFKAFDPCTNRWYEMPPTPGYSNDMYWQGFGCVAVGCTLLLMGGVYQTSDGGVVSGDVSVYNALTNQWSKAASMNTPRSWFAAAVIGELVYVAGGLGKTQFLNSVEVYNSTQNSWHKVPNMTYVRSSCYGLALDGKFWVIGGEYERNQYDGIPKRSSAEVYDPETVTWNLVPQMWLDTHKVPGPNTVHCGRLLFVHESKIMVYDKDTNGWCHVGNLAGGDVYNRPLSRFGFACESLGEDLYIVGGRKILRHWQSLQYLNTVEVCKLLSQRAQKSTPWRMMADMGSNEGNVLASAVLRL